MTSQIATTISGAATYTKSSKICTHCIDVSPRCGIGNMHNWCPKKARRDREHRATHLLRCGEQHLVNRRPDRTDFKAWPSPEETTPPGGAAAL
jgi:hypothetical protein